LSDYQEENNILDLQILQYINDLSELSLIRKKSLFPTLGEILRVPFLQGHPKTMIIIQYDGLVRGMQGPLQPKVERY
jgi:hypothetical protein